MCRQDEKSMKEAALNILDIAQNSIRARATIIEITIDEDEERLAFSIRDNGCGMEPGLLSEVTDPFKTTKKDRKVGLGIPLLKMEAEMTGGEFKISSVSESASKDHGTSIYASFLKRSIDYIPLGDIIGTVCALIQGANNIDIIFTHNIDGSQIHLSTIEMRDVTKNSPISHPYVISWIKEYLKERYDEVFNSLKDQK